MAIAVLVEIYIGWSCPIMLHIAASMIVVMIIAVVPIIVVVSIIVVMPIVVVSIASLWVNLRTMWVSCAMIQEHIPIVIKGVVTKARCLDL